MVTPGPIVTARPSSPARGLRSRIVPSQHVEDRRACRRCRASASAFQLTATSSSSRRERVAAHSSRIRRPPGCSIQWPICSPVHVVRVAGTPRPSAASCSPAISRQLAREMRGSCPASSHVSVTASSVPGTWCTLVARTVGSARVAPAAEPQRRRTRRRRSPSRRSSRAGPHRARASGPSSCSRPRRTSTSREGLRVHDLSRRGAAAARRSRSRRPVTWYLSVAGSSP